MSDRTPVSRRALERVIAGDPVEHILSAWTQPGVSPAWHAAMQSRIRRQMPLLGAALDRLAAEHREPRPHNQRSTDG